MERLNGLNGKLLSVLKILSVIWFIPFKGYTQKQGKLRLDHLLIGDEQNKMVKISSHIWYSGNKSIQEVRSQSSHDSAELSKIKYFLFIDPHFKYYAYYGNFSDTSTLIKYSNGDNLFLEYGGWDMYSTDKFSYNYSRKMADTIMNGKIYARRWYRKSVADKKKDYILYASCEYKTVPIKFLKAFSDEIGCPVTIMETYFDGRLEMSSKVIYLAQSLSEEEKKVFRAWKKKRKYL